MTSAPHLHLDEQRLAQTSKMHAINAANSLKKMLEAEWPVSGSTELETQVLEFEEQLIKAAIFGRRVQDRTGHASVRDKQGTSLNSPFVAFADGHRPSDDLRLVANKIVHHSWLHAARSGSFKIETITSECDRGTFTKFDVTQFCDQLFHELTKSEL